MIKPHDWMPVFAECLRRVFGERLLYLGLQGSYRRGEATETSDIDVVCVIDRFTLADLDAYRDAVRSMPEGEKACGFLGGREELAAWPRHELFSLKMDTMDYFGRLEDFLPEIGRADAVAALRAGAAGLYHPLVHTYLYGTEEAKAEFLRAAFKGAFFVLLAAQYLRTGEFCRSRRELAEALSGDEKKIALADAGQFSIRDGYALLLAWARSALMEE